MGDRRFASWVRTLLLWDQLVVLRRFVFDTACLCCLMHSVWCPRKYLRQTSFSLLLYYAPTSTSSVYIYNCGFVLIIRHTITCFNSFTRKIVGPRKARPPQLAPPSPSPLYDLQHKPRVDPVHLEKNLCTRADVGQWVYVCLSASCSLSLSLLL